MTDARKLLPTDAKDRECYLLADGLLYYFMSALFAVAKVSFVGNEQHHPGEPMYWDRTKSTDHANKALRHMAEAGGIDTDGERHTAKFAWRALAMLQEELEREEGAPLPRNARLRPPEMENALGLCAPSHPLMAEALRAADEAPLSHFTQRCE